MRHHLLIAGTGRAGTTFLVQYLAACGMDTQLARGQHQAYDEDANAGFETLVSQADAPYVCKSPWLFEFADRLLEHPDITIDAVIIPMRSLVEAATSRVINELRSRHAIRGGPEDVSLWSSWGVVPGGVVYSLNPLDQARVLAMGFHQLLHALVRHEVPVVFLDFPRLVEDAEYLYTSLRPVLGDKVGRERALEAHLRIAAPDKVRVGREIARESNGNGGAPMPRALAGEAFPSHDALNHIALLRELDKARALLQAAQAQRDAAHAERAAALAELEHEKQMTLQTRGEQKSLLEALENAARERERAEARRAQAEFRSDALEASTSWRVTAPLRRVSTLVRRRTTTR